MNQNFQANADGSKSLLRHFSESFMSIVNRSTLIALARTFTARFSLAKASIRHLLLDSPKPLRIVLVSDGRAYTSEQQFAPLFRHAAALRKRFGMVLEPTSVERALAATGFGDCAILGLKLSFLTPAEEASRIARELRAKLQGTSTRFVYFDGDDDLCVLWPDVLAQVDRWVKKHAFADRSDYARQYIGKSNLTDMVSREHGYSFEDNVIRSSGPVSQAGVDKLLLGWNIALDDKIVDLVATLPAVEQQPRDIDVCSRAFVKPDVWIYPLRGPLVERIEAMKDRFKVLAPRERVSQEQYYTEMLRSRICVSPFGYGELCWRDFEAVLCGCLLVKPSMSHVRTYPDIFVPGETYAPVRWDYSDLSEVCARYLDDEPERARVAARARATLLEALGESAFIERVALMLSQLDLPANALPR